MSAPSIDRGWRCEGMSADEVVSKRQAVESSRPERPLVCATCRAAITWDRARVEVLGAHEHTFVNPHGLVFEIGCFDAADGCRTVGDPSDDFSWFPGYAWQIAICRGCETHLGWSYDRGAFWGLILDRLTADDIDVPTDHGA